MTNTSVSSYCGSSRQVLSQRSGHYSDRSRMEDNNNSNNQWRPENWRRKIVSHRGSFREHHPPPPLLYCDSPSGTSLQEQSSSDFNCLNGPTTPLPLDPQLPSTTYSLRKEDSNENTFDENFNAALSSDERYPAGQHNNGNHHRRSFRDWSPGEGSGSSLNHHRSSGGVPAALQVTIQKTRLCVHLTQGRRCPKNNCMFAHSTTELRARPNLFRTKLCRMYNDTGTCENGNECRFAHGLQELRHTKEFYKTALCAMWKNNGLCKVGESCRFAHGPQELRPPPSTTGDHRNPSYNGSQHHLLPSSTTNIGTGQENTYSNRGRRFGGGHSSEEFQRDGWNEQEDNAFYSGEGNTKPDAERVVMRTVKHHDMIPVDPNVSTTDDQNLQQTTTADCSVELSPRDPSEARTSDTPPTGQDPYQHRRCPPPPPPPIDTKIRLMGHQWHGERYWASHSSDVARPHNNWHSCQGHLFDIHQGSAQSNSFPLSMMNSSGTSAECMIMCEGLDDGVVGQGQRRSSNKITNGDVHESRVVSLSKIHQNRPKQHMADFWPVAYERSGVDSPAPSTHSSPPVVFRTNNIKGGRQTSPQRLTEGPDWLTHLSNLKPAVAMTQESIYAIQYED